MGDKGAVSEAPTVVDSAAVLSAASSPSQSAAATTSAPTTARSPERETNEEECDWLASAILMNFVLSQPTGLCYA